MKKILFITHETSRTGAPLVVLRFLKWIQINKPEVIVDVLALSNGTLESDFKKACGNYYDYIQLIKPIRLTFFQRILLKLKLFKKPNIKEVVLKTLAKKSYDLIYANSIPSKSIAIILKEFSERTQLLLHVHELDTVMRMYLNSKDNELHKVDGFIAASHLVKSNLVHNWQVDKEKIQVIYEFSQIKNQDLKKETKTFVVGASGTVEWRKGDDVFIQVARYINKKMPEAKIEFVWVGKNSKQDVIEADLKKMNLQYTVKFIGEKVEPLEYFKEFNVFLMTSREDPFPLVCIEVANLKKPIICFEGATGTQEILANGGGYIVPYLDIEQMAEKIMFYYNNPKDVIKDGDKAQILFSKFTPEHLCPIIYNKIDELLVGN